YSGSSKAQVRMRLEGESVVVTVEDFGKGLGADALKSVQGNGAALGVGIRGMHERLRQLAGKLEISSPKAGGTIVTATVPVSTPKADPVSEAAVHPVTATASKKSWLEKTTGSKSRILIADDHEVLRRGVRTMLESEEDLEVCGEAVNGEEVVEKAL